MKFFGPFLLSVMLIVVLNSTGCKKDSPAGPETPKPDATKIYRLSGTILSEYNVPLKGIKVQINDSLKLSDSNGNFTFYCEANDTVNIRISDSLYFPVTQDLSLRSDSSITFHIVKVIPEHTYFPLAVGNKWSYQYYSRYSLSAYLNETQTDEEYFNVDWEVTAFHPETNTYDIKTQSSSGIHVTTVTNRNTNPPAVKKDTAIINPSAGTFQAILTDDLLSLKGESYGAPWTRSVNIRCTPASVDTLELKPYPTSIMTDQIFLKDVGLIYSEFSSHSGGNLFSSYSIKLISYKLNRTAQSRTKF